MLGSNYTSSRSIYFNNGFFSFANFSDDELDTITYGYLTLFICNCQNLIGID